MFAFGGPTRRNFPPRTAAISISTNRCSMSKAWVTAPGRISTASRIAPGAAVVTSKGGRIGDLGRYAGHRWPRRGCAVARVEIRRRIDLDALLVDTLLRMAAVYSGGRKASSTEDP
jgi:hypothetical protein